MNSFNLLRSTSFQCRQSSISLARTFCWTSGHHFRSSFCKKSFPIITTTAWHFEFSQVCNNKIFVSQIHTSPLTFTTNSSSKAMAIPFNLIKCSQQDGLRTITMNDRKTRYSKKDWMFTVNSVSDYFLKHNRIWT